MKFLSLDYIKQHSRIDFDCEDQLLELYADSAEEALAGLLNRGKTVEEMVASLEQEYGKVPARCYQAALMLTEQAYNHRGPVSPTNMSYVPYSFDLLIKPLMRLTSGDDDDDGDKPAGALYDCDGVLLCDADGTVLCGAA